MDELSHADITFENGVAQDSRGKFRGNRQVTVISQESWTETCKDMKLEMPWTTRRANLLVSGLELENSVGKILRIGSCALEIMGELEPCGRMDEQFDGLTEALRPNWRGGVHCRIIHEGVVNPGDEAIFLS